MNRSISLRVKRLFFWSYLLSVFAAIGLALVSIESLETITLDMDKQAEVEHFLNRHETDKTVNVNSALLTLSFIPAHIISGDNIPIIFSGLPVPFEGEVTFLGKEYNVIIDQIPQGTYYLAKDLSQFEKHEVFVERSFIGFSLFALVLSVFLAIVISRLISRPIERLTEHLKNIRQGDTRSYPPTNFRDIELNNISETVNHYLGDIDQLISRERSLISMASHELRTPIAVILGAAEVIEHRNTLQDKDAVTLQRIKAAAQTMSDNVQALLSLVRQDVADTKNETFSLTTVAQGIVAELCEADAKRVEILPNHNINISSNKVMLRMTLQNIVTNALNHNQGPVKINLSANSICVEDQGGIRNDENVLNSQSTGLGLYIVTLICEKMHWQFELKPLTHDRHTATISMTQS